MLFELKKDLNPLNVQAVNGESENVMITCYIILGILLWTLGSLGTTWLFSYMIPTTWAQGVDEISGYIFFIAVWPILLPCFLFCLILERLNNIWDNIWEIFTWDMWFNPLRLWDKVAKHGSKMGKAKHNG